MAGIKDCNGKSLDIVKIAEDDIIIGDGDGRNSAWVRADVDEKIYVKPDENPKNPYVVVKFNDACLANICDEPTLLDLNKSFLLWSTAIQSIASSGTGNNDPTPPPTSSSTSQDKQANTICGVNKDLLKEVQKRVDSSSINEKGFQAAAVIPTEAIIPMKSNIVTYGPYASSNFTSSCGGTVAETNTDLCPWVFGTTALMHAAGQELVNKSVVGLIRSETGSVTVTGLPDIATLGTAIAAGPNLTGINTTFGSSGITTSYEFRTYTPKLGGLSRAYIDRIKRIAKNRQENIKLLRNYQINQYKINRKIRNINQAGGNGKNNQDIAKAKNAAACLGRILIGELNDFRPLGPSPEMSGQRTIVGTETFSKSILEMKYDFAKKSFMSLDGIYGPVSINGAVSGGSYQLPAYISPYEGSDIKHHVSPIHAQPPLATGFCQGPEIPASGHREYNLRIHNLYLNPLANPDSIPHYDKNAYPSGHVGHGIDIVGRENEIPTESGLITNFYANDNEARYSDDYRFLGMRGPIVLHSWGYDVDGKPIPNRIDTDEDTKKGIFKSTEGSTGGLKDQFMKDWLQKPSSWPVGPIDLRFDRERGVWVAPQPFKIVTARIIKSVPKCGEGIGLVINKKGGKSYGRKLFDKDGVEIKEDSECKIQDYCGEETTSSSSSSDECSQWILINAGACSSESSELDLYLALKDGQLVLTYTFNGVTKTTSVQTTTCESSSS